MSLNSGAKSPNAEQKVAIHHEGGKILSAGAGSGKTRTSPASPEKIVNAWSPACASSLFSDAGGAAKSFPEATCAPGHGLPEMQRHRMIMF